MKARYIAIDIETTGKQPDRHSMIALGACVIGRPRLRFYEELIPINHEYEPDSMRIASQGLRILDGFKTSPRFDPADPHFSPSTVLWLLEHNGIHPIECMTRFSRWVKRVSRGIPVRFVSDTNWWDWRFVDNYFETYQIQNPFVPEPLNALEVLRDSYQGITLDLEGADLADNRNPPNNALEDALYNSAVIEYVFARNPRLHALF